MRYVPNKLGAYAMQSTILHTQTKAWAHHVKTNGQTTASLVR